MAETTEEIKDEKTKTPSQTDSTDDKKSDKKEKSSTDDDSTDDDKDADEDKPSAAELQEQADAMKIYKALKGPKGVQALEQLAGQFGKKLEGTKAEKKQSADTIAGMVKEGLGNEYAFMSERLGAVLEEIIETKVMPHLNSASAANRETRVRTTVNELLDERGIPQSIRPELISAMDSISVDFPIKEDGNLPIYVKRLLNLALSEDTKIAKRLKRAKDNDEESDNIDSHSDLLSGYKIRKGPEKRTAKDAVVAAMGNVKWED